jgi:hypothetical protein
MGGRNTATLDLEEWMDPSEEELQTLEAPVDQTVEQHRSMVEIPWDASDDNERHAHGATPLLVVGAGGTGSAIVMGLPYLDQAMRVWGRSSGLDVVMMDADTVSETNCVRQPFSISDIGQNKATVLINRINLFWGTRWRAEPANFNERTPDRVNDTSIDLLIACVDIDGDIHLIWKCTLQ